MDKKIDDLGELIIVQLKQRVTQVDYDRYIKQISYIPSLSTPNLAVFEAPNILVKNWVQSKYSDLIATLFEMKTGVKPSVLLQIGTEVQVPSISAVEKGMDKTSVTGSYLNPMYTFENFVVGGSNEFAYRALKMASEKPGLVYNPLFIHGGVGLGKTHLMHAVGNVMKAGGKTVIYTSVENFLNDFSRYLKNKAMETFKEKYRKCDLLLIDDIQFLKGKLKVQEEFFHTFEALKNENKQIIITSDNHPKKLDGIESRLVNRFEWGLVADIRPPELDTKIKIIQKKCEIYKIELGKEIVHYIATIIENNAREIEGIITKLNAYSQLMGIAIDLEFTRNVLKTQIEERQREITIDMILEIVAKELNIKPSEIRSTERSVKIVHARRIVIYLARNMTPNSMPQLASYFSMKDHTAVSHTMRKIKEMIDKDETFKLKLDELKNKVLNTNH